MSVVGVFRVHRVLLWMKELFLVEVVRSGDWERICIYLMVLVTEKDLS